MNQGKLEVVKQEMVRVNINILGISELKWMGMGKFNSGDHCIYYCGQESLRRIHLPTQETQLVPWVGKISGRRKWQPTPVFFPGKSHGQRSLVGYSPQSLKRVRVRHNLPTKQWQFLKEKGAACQ